MGPNARNAVPDLIELLQGPGFWKRYWAAQLLKEIGPEAKEAVPALRQALKTEKFNAAYEADVDALEAIARDTVVPALIEALQTEEWDIKAMSADNLGRLRSKARAAIPELRKALHDKEEWVRKAAAEALKQIEPEGRQVVENP
jgi:HEAT repeat protein